MSDGSLYDAVVKFAFPAYALFVFGFFLAPRMPEHYEFFYWTLLPAAVLLVPRGYFLLRESRLLQLVLIYLLYMAASSLWSEAAATTDVLFGARLGLYVLAFILVSVVLLDAVPQRFEALLKASCFLAAMTAVAAMLVFFYADRPYPAGRLHGLGRMEYIIRTGYIFGFFAVLALYYLREESRPVWRVAYGVMMVVLVTAVVLTQSRAAVTAFLLAAFVLIVSKYPKWVVPVFAAGLVVVATAIWFLLPEVAAGLSRGAPYRPSIWLHYLSYTWATAPWFGHGLMTQWALISPALPYREAHSAFVGTFRDGGLTGLLLLLAVVGYATVAAARQSKIQPVHGCRSLALIGFLLICILANDERLLVRPQELWLYFWLVLGFVIAGEVRAAGRTRAG
ncbi:MAG: hypothetical protein PVJ83_04185 [Gammaproteobacteria bacterium]|jgi:hypothetical protein